MSEIQQLHASGDGPAVPHNAEAEQQVLGAALLADGSWPVDMIARGGGTALFFDPVHAAIFDVMAEKAKLGHLISPVTVADAMRSCAGLQELGGGRYMVLMAGAAMSSAALPGYIDLLADHRDKRTISALLADANAAIARNDQPAAAVAARVEAGLMALSASAKGGPVSMLAAMKTAMAQIMSAYAGEDSAVVQSGIHSLDKMIGGFYPGELVLIGGRPSMGKTGVALSIALNAARAGHGVCIASLEMNPEAMATPCRNRRLTRTTP